MQSRDGEERGLFTHELQRVRLQLVLDLRKIATF
jgi:hypothetical protein